MRKKISLILAMGCLVFSLTGCSSNKVGDNKGKEEVVQTTITVAAAASLKNCMDDELIPLFEEKYKDIKIQTTYDSSGKLQSQIEAGAEVDVFISAAMKQMNVLNEAGLILEDSITELLENKIVLIVPKDSDKGISSFEEITKAEKIALGDTESVPAGQYAKEAFENLNMWDEVSNKASLGTNVTEVLTWVAEESADAGVVYSTDAVSNDKVEVIAEAPKDSVSKVIYPLGVIKNSGKVTQAKVFTEFLKSEEAMKIFGFYGFVENK